MNDLQLSFLSRALAEAQRANHPFPPMAACEAALESNWGNSGLARQDNNLFGMKQHLHPIFGTHSIPTREFLYAQWVTVCAKWIQYPDWASCFADRLATLQRLSSAYPHYSAALNAQDPETYVRQVSQSWSTDPERADKCISIYQEFMASQGQSGGNSATREAE